MIGNDTVEIVKRTNTGEYGALGQPVVSETAIPVAGCSLQVTSSVENRDTLATVVTIRAKVYMPVTADTNAIGSNDAIRHDGKTYECQGPAIVARSLDGAEHHVWCELKWQAG